VLQIESFCASRALDSASWAGWHNQAIWVCMADLPMPKGSKMFSSYGANAGAFWNESINQVFSVAGLVMNLSRACTLND
jgi:hypothetical protein